MMQGVARCVRSVACITVASAVIGDPALAQRDIVFSARFYNPVASRMVSHFHLYRMNTNGTGRIRLTSGSGDDMEPRWSLDGKRIAFFRRLPSPKNPEETFAELCVIPASGGRIIQLKRYPGNLYPDFRWSIDGNALLEGWNVISVPSDRHHVESWEKEQESPLSPNGRFVYRSSGHGSVEHDTILDRRVGKVTAVQTHVIYPLWLDNQRIAGVIDDEAEGIRIIGIDGKEKSHAALEALRSTPSNSSSPPGSMPRRLQAIPHDRNHVIWWADEGNSTIRPLYGFYRVDVGTGRATPLCDGQFLIWLPDGKRCLTANRTLVPLGKRKNGRSLLVWAGPLILVNTRDGTRGAITREIAWVSGADVRITH